MAERQERTHAARPKRVFVYTFGLDRPGTWHVQDRVHEVPPAPRAVVGEQYPLVLPDGRRHVTQRLVPASQSALQAATAALDASRALATALRGGKPPLPPRWVPRPQVDAPGPERCFAPGPPPPPPLPPPPLPLDFAPMPIFSPDMPDFSDLGAEELDLLMSL